MSGTDIYSFKKREWLGASGVLKPGRVAVISSYLIKRFFHRQPTSSDLFRITVEDVEIEDIDIGQRPSTYNKGLSTNKAIVQ
jgi:hypothetical protein